MKDKLALPAAALTELSAVYAALTKAVEESLSASMDIVGKHGKPNGGAILPWAQTVGAVVGGVLAPLGLAPTDIDEIAALTAGAIAKGEARMRGIRQADDYQRRAPIDPSLN